MTRSPALLLAALALAPALALPVHGDEDAADVVIYRWVDQNGITHYTTDRDRIPSALRDRIPSGAMDANPRERTTPGEAWAVENVTPDAPAPLAPAGVESGPGPAGAPSPRDPALAERIASLEAEIAADEERLKALISDPARADQGTLAADPEFREVARRLPKLQADLRALREREGAPPGRSSPPPGP